MEFKTITTGSFVPICVTGDGNWKIFEYLSQYKLKDFLGNRAKRGSKNETEIKMLG